MSSMGVTMFEVTVEHGLAVQLAKIAHRRSGVVVDEDIGGRTCMQQCRLAFGGGHIGDDRRHRNAQA